MHPPSFPFWMDTEVKQSFVRFSQNRYLSDYQRHKDWFKSVPFDFTIFCKRVITISVVNKEEVTTTIIGLNLGEIFFDEKTRVAQPQIFWLDSQNDVDITDWEGLLPPKKMTQLKEPCCVLFFRYLLEVTCLIEKFISTHSLKGRTHYTVQPSALHICDTARRHVRNGTAIFSKVPATPLMPVSYTHLTLPTICSV